jgi:hypothetical protein
MKTSQLFAVDPILKSLFVKTLLEKKYFWLTVFVRHKNSSSWSL